MAVPADGVPRLMHFVDARLAQLQLTKKDAASRGFPDPSTLPRARDTDTQATPTVRTLLRIDATLGWQPGSAAVIMLGGFPLTITARATRRGRAKEQAAQPMAADEVVSRLLTQLHEEIARTRRDVAGLDDRLDRLSAVHDRLVEEFLADEHLLHEFGVDDADSADDPAVAEVAG
jgi:hypothetical protein